MTVIRLDHHCESVENIIKGLEDGSRTLSSMQTIHLLRELSETVDCLEEKLDLLNMQGKYAVSN